MSVILTIAHAGRNVKIEEYNFIKICFFTRYPIKTKDGVFVLDSRFQKIRTLLNISENCFQLILILERVEWMSINH